MEELIWQCDGNIPNVGDRMMEGQYYLLGPDGEMVMPQVWETMVKPEWHVTMQLWPEQVQNRSQGATRSKRQGKSGKSKKRSWF